MDDVHRLQISTPFHVGRVNCYVFTRDKLTLLDPGPATEEAYEELSAGLQDLGFAISDVDQILISHPHMDHFGLANRLVEESGSVAVAHGDATEPLADPVGHFEREQAFFRPFLELMGVPEQFAESAIRLPEAYVDYQYPLTVNRELTDGDTVDVGVGEDLKVVHTPGHAPGSVCFVSESDGIAFTGDHVLSHITPNPLLTLVPGTDDERTRSLPAYVDSLQTIRAVDASVGCGGHGERMPDLDGRVQEILDHHQERKENIADILATVGPVSPYDVMQEMFPDLPATEVFSGISEVLGHLDLLEDEDRVDIEEMNGVRTYAMS